LYLVPLRQGELRRIQDSIHRLHIHPLSSGVHRGRRGAGLSAPRSVRSHRSPPISPPSIQAGGSPSSGLREGEELSLDGPARPPSTRACQTSYGLRPAGPWRRERLGRWRATARPLS
jgi:hypothetical protein